MEEHRLTPRKECFDEKAFNRIRTKVTPLKKNLAAQISPGRFGMEYEDILSWFDSKTLFIFNRYWDGERTENEVLARVINGLKHFKFRIIRFSYHEKYKSPKVNIEDINEYEEFPINGGIAEEEVFEASSSKIRAINTQLRAMVSEDAYEIHQIEMNPPVYIMQQLDMRNKKLTSRIPAYIIADFLGFEPAHDRGAHYVSECRREINKAIEKLQELAKNGELLPETVL